MYSTIAATRPSNHEAMLDVFICLKKNEGGRDSLFLGNCFLRNCCSFPRHLAQWMHYSHNNVTVSRAVFYGRTSSRLVFIFAPAANILPFLARGSSKPIVLVHGRESLVREESCNARLWPLIFGQRSVSLRRLIEMPRYLTSPSIRERYRNLSGRSKVAVAVAVAAYRKAVIAVE